MTSISSAESLGAIMRARREADGLTQGDIQAATGLSAWHLRRLERGRDNKVTLLLRWMRSLGIKWIIDDPRLTEEQNT